MKKKITIKVNLNDKTKFLLSNAGLDIYKAKTEKLNENCIHKFPLFPKRDDKGFVESQLWSLISMYGEQIDIGKIPPFADNCIYIEVNLEDVLKQIIKEMEKEC